MTGMSVSFTLGKASAPKGANVEHNNREFLADNIDVNRISDNVTYAKQDIKEAYDELFGEAITEYNSNQKRNDRKITDYYNQIKNGSREEAFYEIIVQFGDSKIAPVGSDNGKLAQKMLDEYVRDFEKRNPNLKVFNSVLHMDEASPHLHIDVIPFYTAERQRGLKKGVSMKAALIEQGFIPKGIKQNQLVMWEDCELKVMEKILNNHGLQREVKGATHEHKSVEEFKLYEDEKRISGETWAKVYGEDFTLTQAKHEIAMLKNEKKNLTAKIKSPWKSFYYSSPEKQSYVQSKLDELEIPYRENDNGFEAQEIYVEQIRKIEKTFKVKANPYRDELRNNLDTFIMQSKTFDEVLNKLKQSGYEIKQGKYIAAKPKYGDRFIRFKSLGEDYSEQALRNRITFKNQYEKNLDNKIIDSKNPDSLEVMIYKTIQHYTLVFSTGVLPTNRIKKNKPFSWTNDTELDKLSELNKQIQTGETVTSLKNNFIDLEESVSQIHEKLEILKKETTFFENLGRSAVEYFVNGSSEIREEYLDVFEKHGINETNYERLDELTESNRNEISELEKELQNKEENLKTSSDTIAALEKVVGGTYVQSLIDEERNRRQSVLLPGGVKKA